MPSSYCTQVVREGRVRLDQTLVKLEHSNRTCKMLKEEAQAASKSVHHSLVVRLEIRAACQILWGVYLGWKRSFESRGVLIRM